MASSPEWKIYDAMGEKYQAACKEIEAAACLVSFYGDGSTIRWGHRHVVWVEGGDGCASDSYDATAAIVESRVQAIRDGWKK